MKKLILCIILLLSSSIFAKEFESSISAYRQNYFITGNKQDQVLFQLSMKYNLLYPEKYGLFAGYTQRAWWNLYKASSPFEEFNHEPELFILFKNNENFLNYKMWNHIDYIQVSPIHHKSNGREGSNSRSINMVYSKVQISSNQDINLGTSLKLFTYYTKGNQNKDIHKYTGYYENEIFLTFKSKTVKYFDKEKLYIKHGLNFKSEKGWLEGGIKLRLISSKIQPYLFAQIFHGYGESLIFYDKKETNIRIGVTFN